VTLNKIKTLAFVATILGVSCSIAAAAESRSYPFMATIGQTTQPIGHYEFCQSHTAECAVRSSSKRRIGLTTALWNALVTVNDDVNNKIRAATDDEIFGRAEVWTYPASVGDCEDLVLLKRRTLIEMGWPVGTLLVTVVRRPNGEGHAVLTVLTDRGDLVLDNLSSDIKVWSETPYQYVKRQSELDTGAWLAINDARTAIVGSSKQ
jgi:predicted transglutaminase-like cysteine proteinase